MQKPIYMTFASPKGGVGKTMLTVLTASYLHYKKGYNVAVVDCCYPGYNIGFLRQNEIERIDKDNHYFNKARRQFTAIHKNTYSIINTQVGLAIDEAKKLQEVDLILFDIPNLMGADGTVELLTAMDAIVFPIMNGSMTINAVQRFMEVMNQHVITTGKSHIKEMYLLRNMVSNWDDAAFHANCKAIAEDTGVSLMDAMLPHSKHFRKDVFHTTGAEVCVSTIFPFDTSFVSMLDEFMKEVEQLIGAVCGKR